LDQGFEEKKREQNGEKNNKMYFFYFFCGIVFFLKKIGYFTDMQSMRDQDQSAKYKPDLIRDARY
jgi:hypothetical protein